MSYLVKARKAVWHFRQGGMSQLREWRRRDKLGVNTPGWTRGEVPRASHMPVKEPSARVSPYRHIRVGAIMDDFSLQAWGHEFDVVELKPSYQPSVLDDLDMLFVESAWNGNHGSWQYQLTGSKAPSESLRRLVSDCQERGIPCVFWNKEDPPHFDDFLDNARIFDIVFTSDSGLIEKYTSELGHDRVFPLSFAASASVHNPIRITGMHQQGDVAFAGMYFTHKFPERREQMDLLLTAASRASAKMEHGFDIYSRFQGDDERYQFPAPLDEHVVGSLPYDKMLSAYQMYKVFLNVNSVVNSESMCARRVFEITASGTPVISTSSAAIPRFFSADEVGIAEEPKQAEWLIRSLVNSQHVRDRMVHKAQRKIWAQHTYEHRAHAVLTAAGFTDIYDPYQAPSVTVVVSTNRPQQVDHILSQVAQQLDVDCDLVLVTHNFEIPEDARDEVVSVFPRTTIVKGDADLKLGDCLNLGISHARGDYIAKFDDDDYYLPNYLRDQINALRFSGADLVGKQANYVYLEASGELALRFPTREHKWTTFVGGPTLVAPRETFERVPFGSITHGEDSDLLRRLLDSGGRVYATDRFNFIQMRHASHSHTWQADDVEILANSDVQTFGLNIEHVKV